MHRFAIVALMLTAIPANAETLRVKGDAEAWQKLEQRRTDNHRRDCEAQWLGSAKSGDRAAGDSFVAECVKAASVRCHPRGSDSRCDYTRDRDRPTR